MAEKNPYINLMIESLKKKEAVLDQIIELNIEQTKLVQQEKLELQSFGKSVEKKDELIKQLSILDDGFQSLYDRIKEVLQLSKALYKSEIQVMQQLISRITEKSVSIQAEEARNRLTIESHFAKMKKELKYAKKSNKVAVNYYKNMANLNLVEAQFLDRKK